jgi:hypothetical protein
VTEFAKEISTRIADAQRSARQAREADEPYLLQVHVGDLESLARLAVEHGVVVDGLEESLAEYGVRSPAPHAPMSIDLDRPRSV